MPDQYMRGMMGDPRPPQMDSQILGDPFPNLVRDRDQLSNLWIHIAQVLSDGVRQNAVGDTEGGPAGLPPPSEWAGADTRVRENPELLDPEMQMPRQSGDPGAGKAGRMSAEQVGQAVFNAGFRGEALTTMIAIALAESSGNPKAHNPDASTGDNSYGLFQINMLDKPNMKMGEERRRRYGLSSNEQLWDPDLNARIAYDFVQAKIARGKNPYEDWSVHRNNLHLRFWDVASRAAAAIESASADVTGRTR